MNKAGCHQSWLQPCCSLLAVSLDAQQTGKIFRIGFLDQSTASGSAVLVERSGKS